jgi:hypothetical protein
MSLIRQVSLAGSAFYALIFIIQTMQYRPVLAESIIGIGIIGFLSLLSFKTDEHELHTGEVIIIWACILLFALYALLKAGGVI